MLRSFSSRVESEKLARAAFKYEHRLLGHIPTLHKDRLMCSKGMLKTGAGFEITFCRRAAD